MNPLSRPSVLATAAGICLVSMFAQVMAQEVKVVDASMVCVTNGEIKKQANNMLLIESASSRAVVKASNDDFGALEFEYLGPTAATSQLASGKVSQQLGVKLNARDSCNVVYIMWKTGAEEGLEVTTKINENWSTHAECGVKGYKAVTPTTTYDVPILKPGDKHRLEASLNKQILTVKVDGKDAWQGDIGLEAARLNGYSGLRTDNVRMRFRWLAAAAPPGPEKSILRCKPAVSATESRN